MTERIVTLPFTPALARELNRLAGDVSDWIDADGAPYSGFLYSVNEELVRLEGDLSLVETYTCDGRKIRAPRKGRAPRDGRGNGGELLGDSCT